MRHKHTFFYIFIFLLFCLKGFLFIDPDFGWRLRAGEIFFKNGIPKTDLFSYTMPTFAWVDHAFSQSILFFIVNNLFGYFGLSLLYSVLAMTALLVSILPVKNFLSDPKFYKNMRTRFFELSFRNLSFFSSFPFLLGTSILFTFFGVRAQVVSWLMLSILLLVIFDEKKWNKLKIFLPIYFFIWANLHGSFLSGLATLFLIIVLRSFRTRRFHPFDYLIIATSSLTTLLNPYGGGVWREVWTSVSDTSLRWQIAEWMPALAMFDLAMVFLIGTSVGLIWKYRNKFLLEEKGVYFSYLLQAVGSRRHLPLWVVVSVPLTIRAIYYLWQDAKRVVYGEERFKKIYQIVWISSLVVVVIQPAFAFREAVYLGIGGFYPKGAVSYLQESIPNGEIFSEYGWGGYLIWKLPEKKVFIDGRMPSWKRDMDTESELSDAFKTYNEILKGKVDYESVFTKFGISTVVWSKPRRKTPLDKFYDKVGDYLTLVGIEKSDFELLPELEKDGWGKVYEDVTAVVYQKPR